LSNSLCLNEIQCCFCLTVDIRSKEWEDKRKKFKTATNSNANETKRKRKEKVLRRIERVNDELVALRERYESHIRSIFDFVIEVAQ
jgi:hypothetical protein